eukprot:GSChrysophyteH1.ASY1.ANO1.2406.1 assembled CDS
MQFWIDVARGKKWRETRAKIKMSAIHRYAYHLFDLRWSVLKMLAFLLIVCIIYLIFSESRLVENPYGWITTAAYITGGGATICLTCIYVVVVFLMTLVLCIDNGEVTAVTGEARSGSDEVRSVSLSDMALFAVKMACFIFVIWGVLIAGNAFYLYILLTGSIVAQDSFRYFFAILKWYWVNTITYRLYEAKCLKLGLLDDTFEYLMKKYFGSRLRFTFVMNAVSLFLIPILTQMVVDPACFKNYFEADAIGTVATWDEKYCNLSNYTEQDCPQGQIRINPISTAINANIPFLYNYTCSSSIVRAYVPLYESMYSFVTLKCLVNYLYLFYLAKEGIEEKFHDAETMSWFEYLFIRTIPLNELIWNAEQRNIFSKKATVFPTKTKSWLWKTLPNNLNVILVMLTFGYLAPLVALMASIALFAETYIIELVMGRFLVREISVIIYSRRNVREDALQYEHVVPSRDPTIQLQAEDVNESWGAIAAVKEVEKLCGEIPTSIFRDSRDVILLFTASVLSFLLNDVVNSSGDPYESIYWPSVVMMAAPFVSVIAIKLYQWKIQDAPRNREDGIELTDVAPTKTTKPEETSNPIHL